MGTDKRQRQKEGRQARLESERTSMQRHQRRRRLISVALVTLLVIGALFLIAESGGDDEDEVASEDTTTTTAGEDDTTSTSAAEPATFAFGEGQCPPAQKPDEPVRSFEQAPQRCIEDGVDYAAVVTTSKGSFTIDLLEERAPGTVNNFVVLARYGYYEGDDFHRVIPGFVVQGGDPVGEPPGTGNPGYAIPDELPEAGEYEIGSVAMANSGPDTNGSQFFIVSGENGAQLPPSYSLFGTVTEGMDVVQEIESLGSEDGTPEELVTIDSVEITES